MGYAVYEDPEFPTFRWAGYGVPGECDISDCHVKIDRGMGYRCESYWVEEEILDEDGEVDDFREIEKEGCKLHFCEGHQDHNDHGDDVQPKPDTLEWRRWQLLAPSWGKWREENPATVKAIEEEIAVASPEELLALAKEQDKYLLEDTVD
jgi:Fe-S cluster biosynthesis and repair protein YggX